MTPNTRRQNVEVLLVEDDLDDARHIQRLLTSARTVTDTEQLIDFGPIEHTRRLSETLAILEEQPPDIVLLDLRLPDSDGLETLEHVVAKAPTVPIVVVTGNVDAGMGPAAIQAGAQDYLKKASITDELLRRTFRYALSRHERDRERAATNRRLLLLNQILRRDIRNDAGVIVGQSDELRGHVDQHGTAIVNRLLDTAHDTVERIETVSLIMDSLSTHGDIEREAVDLLEIIERETTFIRERHDVRLTVQQPEKAATLTVAATPTLAAVVRHLLSNAALHTDREAPRINLIVDPAPEVVTVTIADDGVGIPDTLQPHLDDFDASTHDRSGIGTGLFLVLTTLERIGAEIEFADNDPRGTVVTVRLERM